MTVYIVTHGQYSDYHIVAVYDNKKAANNHAFNISNMWNDGRVEEYEINNTCEKMRPRWSGIMYKDGHVEHSGKDSHEDKPYIRFCAEDRSRYTTHKAYMTYSIETETEEKAVKIINEKRAILIASGYWDNPASKDIDLKQVYYEL